MRVQVKGKAQKIMSWDSHNWKDESGWKEGLKWKSDYTQKKYKCKWKSGSWSPRERVGTSREVNESPKETTSLEVNGDIPIKLDY